jgi:hypothetical protein
MSYALPSFLMCHFFTVIDLYLIRPPPEALHRAVHPSQIVFGGDSAGGGMVLALLQIIRDSGLPLPAAAVLISPWSDMTHSFPSVFQNTATVSTGSAITQIINIDHFNSYPGYHTTIWAESLQTKSPLAPSFRRNGRTSEKRFNKFSSYYCKECEHGFLLFCPFFVSHYLQKSR